MLNQSGIDAVQSDSVRDGVEIARRQTPSILISQEHCEGGTVQELLDSLKRNSPELVAVVVLERRDAQRALEWMEAGAHECLYEPLNVREFQAVVGAISRRLMGSFYIGRALSDRVSRWMHSIRHIAILAAAVLGFVGLLWIGQHYAYKFRTPSAEAALPLSFRLPYPNPTGIAFDERFLWIADATTQTIYKHAINAKLSLEEFFPMTEMSVVSIAAGDNCLWTASRDGTIRRHILDGKLTVSWSAKVPSQELSGIAWDGKHLWSCDALSRRITKHLPNEELSVAAAYEFPGKMPVAMCWNGRNLWVADGATGTLYRLQYADELFALAETLRPAVHQPGANPLSGIAFDGWNLWTVSAGNGMAFRHLMTELRGG